MDKKRIVSILGVCAGTLAGLIGLLLIFGAGYRVVEEALSTSPFAEMAILLVPLAIFIFLLGIGFCFGSFFGIKYSLKFLHGDEDAYKNVKVVLIIVGSVLLVIALYIPYFIAFAG